MPADNPCSMFDSPTLPFTHLARQMRTDAHDWAPDYEVRAQRFLISEDPRFGRQEQDWFRTQYPLLPNRVCYDELQRAMEAAEAGQEPRAPFELIGPYFCMTAMRGQTTAIHTDGERTWAASRVADPSFVWLYPAEHPWTADGSLRNQVAVHQLVHRALRGGKGPTLVWFDHGAARTLGRRAGELVEALTKRGVLISEVSSVPLVEAAESSNPWRTMTDAFASAAGDLESDMGYEFAEALWESWSRELRDTISRPTAATYLVGVDEPAEVRRANAEETSLVQDLMKRVINGDGASGHWVRAFSAAGEVAVPTVLSGARRAFEFQLGRSVLRLELLEYPHTAAGELDLQRRLPTATKDHLCAEFDGGDVYVRAHIRRTSLDCGATGRSSATLQAEVDAAVELVGEVQDDVEKARARCVEFDARRKELEAENRRLSELVAQPPELRSIEAALVVLRRHYDSRLVVSESVVESASKCGFRKVSLFEDVVRFLVFERHRPGFPEAFKAAFGRKARWRGSESAPTMNRYGSYRSFVGADGVEREYQEHVTLGHGERNADTTMQIYLRKVSEELIEIVYAGVHLPTPRANG